ncbi:hypothetical protein D3C80_1591280 [compost metagenome]
MREQGRECGFDIANQRHIDLAVRTNAAGINIDLDDFRVRRIERAIGELRAEQHQRVGVHHGVEAAGKTDQAGHSHVVRVIVLHMFFAAQGMNNRCFQFAGKFQQLFMRARAAAAAHQGNVAGVA